MLLAKPVAEGGVRRVPGGGKKGRQGEGQDLRHPRALQARLLLEVHHGVAEQGACVGNAAPCVRITRALREGLGSDYHR